jgi:NTE family protein
MGIFSWLLKRNKPQKIKLGIALGSGGAKGFVHIGALKAFEENGIEFDIVAGTSIGSVVGAFYSAGYSPTDIIELLKRIDLGEIKNLFMVNSSAVYNLIDREIGSINIEELKKPFKAVATVLETGKEHVFETGSVADALCASSSIPPFFKPYVIDGERYVDGAFTNSIPADLVRGMGADYVVGIDLSAREAKHTLLSKLFPTYKTDVKEPWKKGYDNSDIVMHPQLDDYSSVAFWLGEEMYDIGYNEALKIIPTIKADIEKLKTGKKKK